MDSSEHVLAVPTHSLKKFLTRRGLLTENTLEITGIISKKYKFMTRSSAEVDANYKQIIPYVTIIKDDSVFCTRRLKKSGETRLHGLISLGIGGHIDMHCDAGKGDIIMRGLLREVDEELVAENIIVKSLNFHGFINDDSNDVGKVHLGLFCTMSVAGEVAVRETEKLEGFFVPISSLEERLNEMETWSQIVVPFITKMQAIITDKI